MPSNRVFASSLRQTVDPGLGLCCHLPGGLPVTGNLGSAGMMAGGKRSTRRGAAYWTHSPGLPLFNLGHVIVPDTLRSLHVERTGRSW